LVSYLGTIGSPLVSYLPPLVSYLGHANGVSNTDESGSYGHQYLVKQMLIVTSTEDV